MRRFHKAPQRDGGVAAFVKAPLISFAPNDSWMIHRHLFSAGAIINSARPSADAPKSAGIRRTPNASRVPMRLTASRSAWSAAHSAALRAKRNFTMLE